MSCFAVGCRAELWRLAVQRSERTYPIVYLAAVSHLPRTGFQDVNGENYEFYHARRVVEE